MDETIKRIMPSNQEAEQSVIGSMLMDQEAILVASEKLNEDDFYNPRYKVLFSAINSLYQSGSAVDLITLTEKLKERKVSEEISSIEFISNIISSVPTSANVKYYADIVAQKALLRRLIRITEDITNRGYQDSSDINELLEDTEREVFQIVNSRTTSEDFTPINEVALETLENIQSAAMSTGSVTLPGFVTLTTGPQDYSLLTLF